MSAPSGTQWGSTSTGTQYQGRIGLYVTSKNSKTQTTVTVQIWYWSQYSCQDSSNMFYFDWGVSASSSIGSKDINTTSNNGWNTANQVLIGTYSKTYNRGTSSSQGTCSARFTGIEYGGGNSYTASVNFTIPARDRYSISYNANGGTGAPSTQYYYYGYDTTLSKTIPKRTGYTFLGWSLSSTAISPSYSAGQAWGGTNADNYILYAVWEKISCAIKFDAGSNGGIVGSSDSVVRTVYYGDKIGKLPTAERLNYEFLGWNTNQNGSGTYISESYVVKANITLYAIFKLQANCYTKQSSKYKTGMMYRKDGKYSTGIVKVKVNGKYKDATI
jgi:uncharacterized repeat protein (TIGR02543 family)